MGKHCIDVNEIRNFRERQVEVDVCDEKGKWKSYRKAPGIEIDFKPYGRPTTIKDMTMDEFIRQTGLKVKVGRPSTSKRQAAAKKK
jgi:hypothetical protein